MISQLCELLGVSKQAYFKRDEDRILSHAAMESFALEYAAGIRKLDPGIGMMKLWYMYQDKFRGERDILGRDIFVDLLANAGMKVRLKVRKPKTTDSTHGLPVYPDLRTNFIPTAPNQLWVSDITYIEIWSDDESSYSFCYLSLILDGYTEEIVGWSLGDSLETEWPMRALRMALARVEGAEHTLIHHSDRGVQYASYAYTELLKTNRIKISMTESGDPRDNPQAERINNTMKNELLKGRTFHSKDEAESAIGQAIDFYNNMRPHMSVDMKTPIKAAKMEGTIKKRWKSHRENAILGTRN